MRVIVSRLGPCWRALRSQLAGTVKLHSRRTHERATKGDDVGEGVDAMDAEHDSVGQTMRIGEENLQILLLAGAWCQNMGYTKGLLGVGLVEEMTGLPVSGGSLRCDFAKAPSILSMRLKETAVGFYEENCIGCAERIATEATDATEHLGSWADEKIADRERMSAKAAQERQKAVVGSRSRAANRRLILGRTDPATQSILDLLDQVDSVDRNKEAEELLIKHAEMVPSDFSDAVVGYMTTEAMDILNGVFLEASLAIFERQSRPSPESALQIAFQALSENIALSAAGRIIATHAHEFNVDEKSLKGVVTLAAGWSEPLSDRRVDPQPAALLRFYDCEPEGAVGILGDLLQEADVWTRAHAAHAAERLIAARPESGMSLLPELLDSLRLPDASETLGDPFAAGQAAKVVADIFVANIRQCDEQLAARVRHSDPSYFERLWGCYASASPSRYRESVPEEAIERIVERSLVLLEDDAATDTLIDVAENLSHICREHAIGSARLIRKLICLAILWTNRLQELDTIEPASEDLTAEAFFTISGERSLRSGILNRLKTGLEEVARTNPGEYVTQIEAKWNSIEEEDVRSRLLDVLQRVVHEQESWKQALPLIERSLRGDSPSEKAAALRVLGATQLGPVHSNRVSCQS